MKRIEFHPDAAREANDAVDYYDESRAGLGEAFRADLQAALARIGENPEMYAELSGMRECTLSRFPYSVHYAELEDIIWVAAVGHHNRRPGFWSRRRPG